MNQNPHRYRYHAAPGSRKARAPQRNFGAAGRVFDSTRVRVLAKDERMMLR